MVISQGDLHPARPPLTHPRLKLNLTLNPDLKGRLLSPLHDLRSLSISQNFHPLHRKVYQVDENYRGLREKKVINGIRSTESWRK